MNFRAGSLGREQMQLRDALSAHVQETHFYFGAGSQHSTGDGAVNLGTDGNEHSVHAADWLAKRRLPFPGLAVLQKQPEQKSTGREARYLSAHRPLQGMLEEPADGGDELLGGYDRRGERQALGERARRAIG